MHLKYYTIFFLVIFYLNSAISQSNIDKDKDKTVDDSDILYWFQVLQLRKNPIKQVT